MIPIPKAHIIGYTASSLFMVFLSLGLRVLERQSKIEKMQEEMEKAICKIESGKKVSQPVWLRGTQVAYINYPEKTDGTISLLGSIDGRTWFAHLPRAATVAPRSSRRSGPS